MANIKVKDLNDISSVTVDNQLMVLTNDTTNRVQNITIDDLLTNIISANSGNVLQQGTDNKLYVQTPTAITGNLSSLSTQDKTTIVNAINEVVTDIGDLSTLDTTDKASIVDAVNEIAAVAVPSLQYSTMNNSKALETGGVSTDTTILADVINYAHSLYNDTPFTQVGTDLSISDGVASGFTTSDYLSLSLTGTFATGTPFEFDASFTTPASFGGAQTIWAIGNGYRMYQGSTGTLYCRFWSQEVSFPMTTSTTYVVKFIFDGSKIYALYRKKADASWTSTSETTISTSTTQNNPTITIGAQGATNAFNGSIDLKYFSVTLNGSLLVSGYQTGSDTLTINGSTVTIPYIKSKTGSKIAPASQRTNITNLYNQEGLAPYYTLDEINGDFTLPAGEIYGMMTTKDKPYIIEAYKSGSDWYNLYSNGFLEQGGLIANVTNTVQSLYLNKSYGTASNTDYGLFVSIDGLPNNVQTIFANKLTSNSFRVQYTGTSSVAASWYACGYIS